MDLSIVVGMLLRKRCSRGDFGQRRTRQRIVDAILGAETLDERNRLLEEVAVQCRRAWVGKAPEQALLLKEHSDALFALLTDRILEEGQLDLFLADELSSWELVTNEGVDPGVMYARPSQYSDKEFRYFGRMVFEVVFCRHVGNSLERSLAFALALLERLDSVWQATLDDPSHQQERWERWLEERLGVAQKDLWRLVKMMESDPAACRRLLEEHGVTSEEMDQWGGSVGRVQGWQVAAAQRFLLTCATMPSHENTPAKRWLENLIEAAARGHRAADDAVRAFFYLFTSLRPDDRLVVLRQDEGGGALDAGVVLDGILSGVLPQRHSTPVLVLKTEHQRMFLEWAKQERRSNEAHFARSMEQLRWFQEHQLQIHEATERRMEDIRDHPRRALLPGGCDHVEVHVSMLRQVGIRAIVFHAEGYEFPDVGIDILTRGSTPHLIRRRVSLGTIPALLDKLFISVKEGFHYPDEARVLLRAVVVDALHRLIVGDRELRERRHGEAARSHAGTEAIDLVPQIRKRRAHLRRLPAGHQASPEAAVYASEIKWKLPPGITFVRAYYEEEKIVYDLPTEPTAVYVDDDLFDLGGDQ